MDKQNNSNMKSPKPTKHQTRRTVVDKEGKRRVVEAMRSPSPGSPLSASPGSSRRRKLKKGDGDIFGDFFGFGPNPPGCHSKGAEPINVKAEKEKFSALLVAEARRYDTNGMRVNLNGKID